VTVLELREAEPQESENVGITGLGQVFACQPRHLLIVESLAARVNRIAAAVPAQVAVECRTNMVQFVEQRDEFLVEIQLQKARETKRHQVKHFAPADEVALHLEDDVLAPPRQGSVAEAERRHSGLEPVSAPRARLRYREQQA